MASVEQRHPTSHVDQHLQDARRHALSAGLRWFWAISQLAILYLLALSGCPAGGDRWTALGV